MPMHGAGGGRDSGTESVMCNYFVLQSWWWCGLGVRIYHGDVFLFLLLLLVLPFFFLLPFFTLLLSFPFEFFFLFLFFLYIKTGQNEKILVYHTLIKMDLL